MSGHPTSETKGRDDPAFPTQKVSRNSYGDIDERTTVPGLTKREWFAAMTLQGILSNSGRYSGTAQFVKDAVELADALLKELAK